jgi:predicted dehydrogenase
MEHNKLVFGVMQNRYSPPSVWLKEVVGSGVLGKIFFVQVNCFWNRDERYYSKSDWKGTKHLDGGTLFTQFSHFIDIMFWLFGDIEDMHSYMNNFSHQQNTEFEDTGVVTFRFRDGAMGCFNFSTSVYEKNFESSITIIGENGTIKVGGQYMEKVELCNIKDYTMPKLDASNPPNDYGNYKGSAANHNYVIQNTIDVLKGRTKISTNAMEGLKVVEIIQKMYTANGNNGWHEAPSRDFRTTKY